MPTKIVSGKKIPVFVFVPPTLDAEFKVEIVTSSETIDITDDIISGEYTDGVTETIGNFTFTIDNNNSTYSDKFSLYDEIRIYSDYSTSATTLRFAGLLEKVSSRDEDIVVSGRSIASKVMGITVTYSTTNYTHEILSTILTNYASYITQTNIDTTEDTDESITVNWYQKPFWECVLELCNRSGYDAYIDCNSDFNYFVSGSRENTTDAVVHDFNLIEVGDFTPDLTVVKNRVVVYGAVVEEQQIIWTEEDDTSIASYKVKELIINDTNIITVAQAQARAEYELSLSKDPPIVGEVTSDSLATILPGEKIRISDQDSGLYPIFYNIQKFTQKFGDDESTVLTILKEQSSIPKILKKRITFETQAIDKTNPNEMRFSWFFDFNTDSGTKTNTTITDGVLKTDGSASGTWISETNSLSENATACELRVKVNATGTKYYVSFDGGITGFNSGEDIPLNTLFNSRTGPNLKIKIELNSASVEIDSISLLYKQ